MTGPLMPSGSPPLIRTPGVPQLQLPPGFVGPPTPQDIAAETQGVTPEAVQLLQAQLAQKEMQDQEKRKKAIKAIYGDDFPLVLDHEPGDQDWATWTRNRWENHRAGVQHNIWLAERNRQFRAGFQWQSRVNAMGAWRETPIPKDSVKIVDNRVRPALAWAMQVVSEQRPGWQFKPTNTDADRLRKADAMQRAVEYQYDAQKKQLIDKEAVYWAQTDGVSFQMTYWDPEKGPWAELEEGKGPVPLGEPCTKVYRLEQVRVSSEATSTVAPMYWLVRDILPMQQAVALYGPDVDENPDQALLEQDMSQYSTTNQYAFQPLYQNQRTVARYTVFCDKSEWLPDGLTAIVCGKKLVYGPVGLLMGRVPMVRITDGSEDPSFFPLAKMNLCIAPQMRINMLWSKWYESIRKNSGGRYATKTNSVVSETFIGGETSLLEIRAAGPVSDSIMAVQAFSVGADIKDALQLEIKTIEDLTGYTAQARGQNESDQSGRAILAQQESLQRVFAPQVAALADANTEWAKQMIGWMKFGYQMPRQIAILGKNRSDLAMELTAEDLDGIVDVTVDPQTLIPQPYALKRWELDNALAQHVITPQEYRERSAFADVIDMQTPNEVQYDKAKRVTEQLMLRQPPEPIVWQDDEAIQQNVLERDILLAGGIDPDIMQAANERWQQLAQQHQQKMGPPPPQPGSPDALYQQFIAKIQQDAVTAAEQLLAKTIETATFGGVPMANAAIQPQAMGIVHPAGHPNQPGVVGHIPPAGGHRAPPLPAGVNPGAGNPSIAQPPITKGGPAMTDQERAAQQFEAHAAF